MQHCSGPKCNVDTVEAIQDRQRSRVRAARIDELPRLLRNVSEALDAPLADVRVVENVLAHDPESVWAFERGERLVGGVAFLFLNREGISALTSGLLDPGEPHRRWLVSPHEKPVGIYIWALLGRGRAATALSIGFVRLRTPRYVEADLWAIPSSEAGARFTYSKGFEAVPERPGLFRFRRDPHQIPVEH
jgi:hypothetical protein